MHPYPPTPEKNHCLPQKCSPTKNFAWILTLISRNRVIWKFPIILDQDQNPSTSKWRMEDSANGNAKWGRGTREPKEKMVLPSLFRQGWANRSLTFQGIWSSDNPQSLARPQQPKITILLSLTAPRILHKTIVWVCDSLFSNRRDSPLNSLKDQTAAFYQRIHPLLTFGLYRFHPMKIRSRKYPQLRNNWIHNKK